MKVTRRLRDQLGTVAREAADQARERLGLGEEEQAAAVRIEEERRLMYVGITRAQRSFAVSWSRKRKKGREMVPAQPSRFIAEMALDMITTKEDPREKLKALRAEFARKAQESAAAASAAGT